MLLPKENRLRDKKWIVQVRQFPCILTHCMPNEYMGTDPHHLMTGRHSTMKAPDNHVVPLRHDLHALIGSKKYPTEYELFMDYMNRELMGELTRAWAEKLYRDRHHGETG